MKAMIFAAGKGTRLKPVTDHIPKALVPFNGKPLLQVIIEKCKLYGISDITVNTHHFAGQINDFLSNNSNFGVNINISDESELILDTGGGLKKASKFLSGDEPILLHNVDIICDIDLSEFFNQHKKNNSLATLLVMERNSNRRFLIDYDNNLCGWENITTKERKWVSTNNRNLLPVSYCGIAIVESKFLSLIPFNGVFSLIDVFLEIAKHYPVKTYLSNTIQWFDVGTIEKLEEAQRLFK
jgi:NDP-sugar pyrophosphorylase family protein